jgi:hypothetical protein
MSPFLLGSRKEISSCVAGQALSGTSLLITPCDGLYISSARMLQSIQHTLSPSFSVYNPAPNRATSCVYEETLSEGAFRNELPIAKFSYSCVRRSDLVEMLEFSRLVRLIASKFAVHQGCENRLD